VTSHDGFTVYDRLAQLRPETHRRLGPYFGAAGVEFPPARAVLVAIKRDRRLELYAGPAGGPMRFIRFYRVMGASGDLGPKLREGYHVSLKIDYPNLFDKVMATIDDRHDLGSQIFIHGGVQSAGCLAVSDRVAEELFVLAAETGIDNVTVISTPVDFRRSRAFGTSAEVPPWSPRLYSKIQRALSALPPGTFDRRDVGGGRLLSLSN